MKPDNPAKHFIIPFLLAVVIYAVSYGWIEHRRARKGPWVVAFTSSADGAPKIVINQSKVGVTNVQLIFAGEIVPATNTPGTLTFGQPRAVPFDIPFGQCIFMDPTFLPISDHEAYMEENVWSSISTQRRGFRIIESANGTCTLQPSQHL